jgi:N-acetylmuramoyl-L-alanine amidase|tara:strand:- start:175 stop:621 length:447 start_codon:yes stop_codon:yes gene_type:complete
MKSKRKVNKIILHCTATPEGRDISAATIKKWHTDKGWSDIGYHYVVKLDGTVEEGRPVKRQGAHVRGHNKNSIGISYVGGCDASMKPKDTRTEDQVLSLDKLITNLLDRYPGSTLHGHNEFSSKACPSFDVQEEYKDIIEYFKDCDYE